MASQESALPGISSEPEMEDSGREVLPRWDELRPGRQRPDGPAPDDPNPVRPRSSRRATASAAGRVFLLLAALIVFGGLGGSVWLLSSYVARDARFRLDGESSIQATGLTEVSRAQMLPVFADDIGRNIFFVPLNQRRRQLEEIPWIEKATVMRILPDRIRVSVVERRPVAFVRLGSQIGLVDSSGVLLAMPAAMMAQHHYSFPTLSGIDASAPLAARGQRMEVYLRLLNELDASGQKLSAQISEVDLTDPGDARVTMEDDPDTLLHFGQERFLERYQRYKAHIAEWRQKYPQLAAVDLRYEQQVVLQMTPGSSVAQAAADEQSAAATGDAANTEEENPPAAHPAGKTPGKTGAKPVPGANAAAGNSAATKPTAKAKPVNAPAKPGSKISAKPKTAPTTALKIEKLKARDKKRAEARRAALNLSRQKAAPTNRPASSAGMGQ